MPFFRQAGLWSTAGTLKVLSLRPTLPLFEIVLRMLCLRSIHLHPQQAISDAIIKAGYIIYRRRYKISEEFYAQILGDLKGRGELHEEVE